MTQLRHCRNELNFNCYGNFVHPIVFVLPREVSLLRTQGLVKTLLVTHPITCPYFNKLQIFLKSYKMNIYS